MDLNTYFEDTKGKGVLSTADRDGKVDAAIYARPHVMEDGSIALIMNDRLSFNNLKSNPHAAFLFIEDGPGYKGKRFFLTKIREEADSDLLHQLKRRSYPSDHNAEKTTKYLVFFSIDKELPLIGT